MNLELNDILKSGSGKVGGRKSHDSVRNRFGKNESYHWNPNYAYPDIPERKAQTSAFGAAVKQAKAIMENSEEKAKYEAAWKKKSEGYVTLRGYIIAKIRKGE